MVGSFGRVMMGKILLWTALLSASPLSAKNVSLAWDAVDDDIRTYRVYWGFRPGVYGKFVDVGTDPYYTLYHLEDNIRYYLAVTAVDFWGNESLFSNEVATSDTLHNTTPDQFGLNNYPNPFNEQTTLAYSLPEKAHVTLTIYNALGQKVRTLENAELDAGHYAAVWNGDDDHGRQAPSGAYIGVLAVDPFRICRPLLLLR